jgi:hypothetical protein
MLPRSARLRGSLQASDLALEVLDATLQLVDLREQRSCGPIEELLRFPLQLMHRNRHIAIARHVHKQTLVECDADHHTPGVEVVPFAHSWNQHFATRLKVFHAEHSRGGSDVQ